MHFSIQQVGEIIGISQGLVRRWVASGLISPTRGRQRAYQFSFQDLVVLRMAKGLADAKLSAKKISSSLKSLRQQLPDAPPLAGLRIAAIGDAVVVCEGDAQWQIQDGQYVLSFDVAESAQGITFAETRARGGAAVTDWFKRALELEEVDPASAIDSYEKAIQDDPSQSGAYVNWGRLLHSDGKLTEAEAVYVRGHKACPDDAVLCFNFALLREDQNRVGDAIALYQETLANDPEMLDAHYNLGLLYESLNRPIDAVRHFNAYRRLDSDVS